MCKKLMALFLVLVLCSGLMIGCGGNNDEEKPSAPNLNNPPDEEQIAYDLSQFGSDALELNQLTVKSCELVKRQSNPEDKADEAHVKAICEGPFSRMELYFQLDYKFYDVGGWILESVLEEDRDLWVTTYLDVDGNDILESTTWLTGFFPEQLQDARPFRLNKEYTDMEYCIVLNGSVPYDQNGERLGRGGDVTREGFAVDAYVNQTGELRMVILDADGSYIIDGDGNRLSDFYDSISFMGDGSIVAKRDPATRALTYGVIDYDGNVLIEPVHESFFDVREAWDPSFDADATDIIERTYIFYDEYGRFYDEDRQLIMDFGYGNAEYVQQEDMVLVNTGTGYQFYNHNGIARTPEFDQVMLTIPDVIVKYENRYGILPTILTRQELIEITYERMEDGVIQAPGFE